MLVPFKDGGGAVAHFLDPEGVDAITSVNQNACQVLTRGGHLIYFEAVSAEAIAAELDARRAQPVTVPNEN